MTVATKPAATTASHVKPTQLMSGTFVTTDLKRARRMCEELLGLECAEAEPGTLLIRELGRAACRQAVLGAGGARGAND